MTQQPYYMIDFSASACMFEILINDYPVISMNVEGQVSTNLPINYAILESGEQLLSHKILPLLGETSIHEKAELKYDIKLFDVSNDFVFKEQFAEYKSEPIEDKKLPVIASSKKFNAKVPYKLEAWQNGVSIKNDDNHKDKLHLAYNEIVGLINKGDYTGFQKKITAREHNMTSSMYLSKSESDSRIEELIEDFKSGFKTIPVDKKSVFHIYGFGKVAMLKKLNGESGLTLVNEKTKEELMLDISFYLPQGSDKFEVI
ncbi:MULTISPECIES: hypothetical protein [Flavobacterium]|uniref:Uncharacterized protein n=1 Tax=Flavobacterium hankyongi TaxID=1176532 RepID=A0ABP8ZK86_9FLAO|nr:hypothetical protein [Flavobacterium sp. N1846]